MLAKVMAARRDGGTSFADLGRYLAESRGAEAPELTFRAIDLGAVDRAEALETAIAALNAAASLSTRCRRPLYHFSLNWPEGEVPTAAQAFAAADAARAALGMADHQALYVIHRDKAHHHVHVLMNRVHPETGRVVSPRRDYFTLDRVCREIELVQGWHHSPGPHVVVGPPELASLQAVVTGVGPEIFVVRQYRARDPDGAVARAPGARAHDTRRGPEDPSFQRWLQAAPAAALAARLARPGTAWAQIHEVLADFGVALVPAGSGYLLRDEATGTTAKLSQVRRAFARAVKTCGPFVSRDPARRYAPQQLTYGASRSATPSLPRTIEAAVRAEARASLWTWYQNDRVTDQAGRQQVRAQAMAALRTQQEQERGVLRRALQAERLVLTRTHPARSIGLQTARAVYAVAAAKEREHLRLRHREERKVLHRRYRGPGLDWRAWLERAAAAGDAAAVRALQGLRYQEGRQGPAAIHAPALGYINPLRPVGVLEDVAWRWVAGAVRYTRHAVDFAEDRGARLLVLRTEDDDVRAALLVARERYTGPLTLTGARVFRVRTAELAAELGVVLADADLAPVWQAARAGFDARTPDRPVSRETDSPTRTPETPVSPSSGAHTPPHRDNDPREMDRFLREISLPEFLEQHGYVRAPRSTVRDLRMRRDGETLVVTQKDGAWVYFSTADRSDNGTVVTWAQRHIDTNLGRVRQYLRPYLGVHPVAPPAMPTPRPRPDSDPDVAARWHAARLVQSTEDSAARRYLLRRGLSTRTLTLFGDGIRQDARGNALFRHWGVAAAGALAVSGYEVKNSQFSGFAAGGHKGIAAFVHHQGHAADITRLVVTEASLDALSKAQLEGHRTDTAYLSLGGAPGRRTFEALDAYRATLGPQARTLVLALDRDEAGQRLTQELQDRYASQLVIEHDPAPRGKDWNDTLQAVVAEEREWARDPGPAPGRGMGD